MPKSADTARNVAWRMDAPPDERQDAQRELQRAAMPRALSDLMPAPQIQPIIDYIQRDFERQDDELMAKGGRNVIQLFPGADQRPKRGPGMKSLYLDDMQISIQGDYYERPGAFSFDAMRAMVDQTPILAAVLMTRQRQVERFCVPNSTGKGPGFTIGMRDKDAQPGESEKASIAALQGFFTNCGWETRARHRQRMKRSSFKHFMGKLVRDSLTMDSAPIETEWKRDRSLGIDGLYAVDGSTIRLCSEEGYQGDDEIFALQVVQGNIRTAYTYEDLIYVPRNPRSQVEVGGYGMGETELLIRTVTGFLNAFTYNTKFFDSNAIPKGILNLFGNYADDDIASFKRYWNSMVKGINNAWALPVLVSKDQESKAQFESFGDPANDVMFAKWMTFLTSIICAIYCIDPAEINFESFSSDKSTLSGSDSDVKIAASKDKGLAPLLTHFGDVFTEYVVSEFGDKYVFQWTGLNDQDAEQEWEAKKLVLSVDELRAQMNLEKAPGDWGEAPLNPSLITVWSAERQAQQQQDMQDFGTPGAGAPGAADGGDFGEGGDFEGGEPVDGDPSQSQADQDADPADMAKAFGLPIYTI